MTELLNGPYPSAMGFARSRGYARGMSLQGSACVITGRMGALGRGLETHLLSLGARVLPLDGTASPEYFFHVAEPSEALRYSHDIRCCEREVLEPVLAATRLSKGLRYVCLVAAGGPPGSADAAHAAALEDALGYLAKRLGLPFSVLRGRPAGRRLGGVAAMAAYAARARLTGVLDLARA